MLYTVARVYGPSSERPLNVTEHTTEQSAISAYEHELLEIIAIGRTDLLLLTLNCGDEVRRGVYFGSEGPAACGCEGR